MKCPRLLLGLSLCLTIAGTQKTPATSNTLATGADQGASVRLQLSTSIEEQQYSLEAGSRFLRLTVNLNYSNRGERPLLLDKKSSLVYRKLLSSSRKAMLKKKYDYDEPSSFIDVRSMQAAGMRLDNPPEREAFTIIKPGDSFTLKKDLLLRLYDGTKETDDFLHPGTYFLQVSVATWYYFVDPNEYREKWRAEGYLWSHNITSIPMALTIKKSR